MVLLTDSLGYRLRPHDLLCLLIWRAEIEATETEISNR